MKAQKKRRMKGLVGAETPIGVLAYEGDEPVGWCSVAPRETYVRLQRSRTMPRVTPRDTATWTILCFFVIRSRRGQGITRALLDGSVALREGTRRRTHQGHSSIYEAACFQRDGRRWSRGLGLR